MFKSKDLSTKDRLFLAAIKVFAQKGFKEATVREICQLADACNINSINYYFGSKEKLYYEVLDGMFAAHQMHLEQYPEPTTPIEHLKTHIISYCAMLYSGEDIARDFIKIFTAEMARPSKALDKIIEKHTRPEVAIFMAALRELLGPDVPEDAVRDTCVSIGSQIFYYSYAWPIYSKAFPDHPDMTAYYEQLADHILRFSLGGIEAVKKHYERTT